MNETPPVLLILSAMRQSGEAVRFALERARLADAGMVVLYVVDRSVAEHAARELEMSGFMGDEPADLVADVLLKAYRDRGREDVADIVSQAEGVGVGCETVVREGGFYEECLAFMAGRQFAEIVAIQRKRSHLSRYLFGTVIGKLRKHRTEPFTVFTEEEP
jgi:nucleotide-binding universal stress UspA family protein